MNAEQAGFISGMNFNKRQNEKIVKVLAHVGDSARKGEYSAFVENVTLNQTEIRHLEVLGYNVSVIHTMIPEGLTNEQLESIKTENDLIISW